ncbi:MAG: hypothetical protein H7A55_21260 [Verrucomicrobiaceae bacterium]|nr:hypothetical protein [Verrucomicrobiaceae bacterium]
MSLRHPITAVTTINRRSPPQTFSPIRSTNAMTAPAVFSAKPSVTI